MLSEFEPVFATIHEPAPDEPGGENEPADRWNPMPPPKKRNTQAGHSQGLETAPSRF